MDRIEKKTIGEWTRLYGQVLSEQMIFVSHRYKKTTWGEDDYKIRMKRDIDGGLYVIAEGEDRGVYFYPEQVEHLLEVLQKEFYKDDA